MLSKPIGRPKAENPVDIRFSVCLDKETAKKLNEYCQAENVTKSVAVRRGLTMLFAENKKNE